MSSRYLLGGGELSGGRALLHPPQGGLHAINDPGRKDVRPLVHGLVAHTNCFCRSRDGATELLDCLGFVHLNIES